MTLVVRIEKGPTHKMDKYKRGQGWHWALYLEDGTLVGFSTLWYETRDAAFAAAKEVFGERWEIQA